MATVPEVRARMGGVRLMKCAVPVVRKDAAPEDVAEVNALFLLAFDPGTAAWDLRSDGSWKRRTQAPGGEPLRDLQETLIEVHRTRGRLV